jgi:hypothetical protein
MALSYGSRAARYVPVLRVPLCLAALWSFGYDSASLILLFGIMAAVCVVLDALMRALSFRPSASTRAGVRRPAIPRPLAVRES